MKIAIITGSRADRGALEMVWDALAPAHDVRWIEVGPDRPPDDRWEVAYGAAQALDRASRELWGWLGGDGADLPDLVIIHGDRYEILAASLAANILGVPIAHMGGGDITEGSQDDCYRHAITKLSHLHFPTNQPAADRLLQMGEDPARVHMVGDPGIDRNMATELLGRDETFAAVGLAPTFRPATNRSWASPAQCLLVNFHPNTLGDTRAELDALSRALHARPRGVSVVLIGPNADAGNDIIRQRWDWLAQSSDVVYHEDLPGCAFLSLLRWCDVFVGNSSAGFYEAPSFGTPTLNIGDRQKGRLAASSVTTVKPDAAEIANGIKALLSFAGFGKHLMVKNPYGDGHAAERIAAVIGGITNPGTLLRKRFREVSCLEPV